MAELLRGKPVADAMMGALMPRIRACKEAGAHPRLAIVRVGEREDDLSYERAATKRFDALGLEMQKVALDATCTFPELSAVIQRINEDDAIHGCLIFRPLPNHLDEARICSLLDPAKDVDGITEGSLFGVFANRQIGFPPCTADACMRLLQHYGYDVQGKNVVVVGRSLVIGKPVAMMLLTANATVTVAHTRTKDLSAVCREADILVVACGCIGTIGADAVREGQVVIDVGINWDEEAGKLMGDVVFADAEPVVRAITPVPGGVGSVTTAVLAEHVVEAAERTLAD